MTFLAPGFFYASLAVAAAVVALHFIVTRQPRAGVLPTARFVPDLPATATARATRPSDIPLMLLRVLLVLTAGAGLAKPILKPSRGAEARVILADVSRSSADTLAVRDSLKALYRDHDVIVEFDSSARIVSADSITALRFSRGRGSLSAALIAAMRAGSSLRDRADSVQLVIISPFASEEFDAATETLRKLWRGSARIVRAGDRPLAMDSTAKPAVIWPATARPPGAIARATRDTVGAVLAGNALLVASFERRWSYPSDSIRGAEIVARWIDGEPAAIERATASGCVRSVAVPVTQIGDLVIRNDYKRFASAISGECASRASAIAASPEKIAALAGSGGLASRESFRPRSDTHSVWAPWLLALAIAAAIAELFVRRRRNIAVADSNRTDSRTRRAA
jgi:hypothetical protein